MRGELTGALEGLSEFAVSGDGFFHVVYFAEVAFGNAEHVCYFAEHVIQITGMIC